MFDSVRTFPRKGDLDSSRFLPLPGSRAGRPPWRIYAAASLAHLLWWPEVPSLKRSSEACLLHKLVIHITQPFPRARPMAYTHASG